MQKLNDIDIDNDEELEMIDLESDAQEYEDTADDIDEDEEDETISKGAKLFHIFFIIIALAIIGIVIYVVVNWSKGVNLDFSNSDPSSFDVESEDFYIDFNPEEVEGYVDDGELNVVILADQSFSDIGDDTSIANLISKKAGANVTVIKLASSTIALHDKAYNLDYPQDAFSLYYLSNSICGGDEGDYSMQFSALEYIEDNEDYYNYWDAIHKYDFDKADILIISYGVSDYFEGFAFEGDNKYSVQAFGDMDSTEGALDYALQRFKERFPHMQIIVSSPYYFITEDKKGNPIGVDLYNPEGGNLGEYILNLKNAANYESVTFLDNYFGIGINSENYKDYLEDNNYDLNEAGREKIAEHIVSNFYFNKSLSDN